MSLIQLILTFIAITFKSDSSFVTVKSGIFTDVAVTAMFFSNTFSFPLSLKTVRHCLLLAAFQGAAMLQKETSQIIVLPESLDMNPHPSRMYPQTYPKAL